MWPYWLMFLLPALAVLMPGRVKASQAWVPWAGIYLLFALMMGKDFREGVYVLPVILLANIFAGIWLNLSFWYKREEKTSLAIVVTGAGLVSMLVFGFWCRYYFRVSTFF